MIYPKYRTLPALTSIYEYLTTGRCTELSGPYGAYNLYEKEMRNDMIITQLNSVIDNLEQIKQNQFMLYKKLSETQETCREIENELGSISFMTTRLVELNTINAYYNKVTALNAMAINWTI